MRKRNFLIKKAENGYILTYKELLSAKTEIYTSFPALVDKLAEYLGYKEIGDTIEIKRQKQANPPNCS